MTNPAEEKGRCATCACDRPCMHTCCHVRVGDEVFKREDIDGMPWVHVTPAPSPSGCGCRVMHPRPCTDPAHAPSPRSENESAGTVLTREEWERRAKGTWPDEAYDQAIRWRDEATSLRAEVERLNLLLAEQDGAMLDHRSAQRIAFDKAEARVAEWKTALEGLAPGGSEFVDDPSACASFVRDARDSAIRAVATSHKQRDNAEARLKECTEAGQQMAKLLDDEEQENERLEAVIREAPHGEDCASRFVSEASRTALAKWDGESLPQPEITWDDCDCWNSHALPEGKGGR